MNASATCVGWIDLVSTTILAGAIVSAVLVGPPSRAGLQVARVAACLLGAMLLLQLALTGVRLRPMARGGGVAFVAELLATRWGQLWILRVLGLAVLIRGLRAPSRSLALVAAIWLLPRSMQGHAGAHGTLPALIDWVHFAAAVTWLGALLQYALQGDPMPMQLATRLRSVSTGALVVLLPAGVYGALLHVPSLGVLLTSPYGRALSGKLVLGAVLIGLGTANHFRYVPALWRGEPGVERTVYRVVCWELVIGLFVLLLSALLGVLPLPHMLPAVMLPASASSYSAV
jgi:putative copper export protein